jgi:hypothetical protein
VRNHRGGSDISLISQVVAEERIRRNQPFLKMEV